MHVPCNFLLFCKKPTKAQIQLIYKLIVFVLLMVILQNYPVNNWRYYGSGWGLYFWYFHHNLSGVAEESRERFCRWSVSQADLNRYALNKSLKCYLMGFYGVCQSVQVLDTELKQSAKVLSFDSSFFTYSTLLGLCKSRNPQTGLVLTCRNLASHI